MASLPYPRSQNNTPTEFTEFTEQIGREYSPTEFTEFTEQTGREYSPTDFTDLHRYLLPQISQIYTDIYSHRFHRFTQIFTPTEFTEFTEQTGREYSPTDFTDLHRYLLPQNSRNTQNILLTSV